MPIDQLAFTSHPAFEPGTHADAAPTLTTGLLEEIRWLRRELRHQQDRADQTIRYERDRARIIALDAEQARRRADALDCEVTAKNIELITLQVRLDDLQSRLAAQQAARRRREARPISRRPEASRSSLTPDKWLRPETLVSGLIGVCIGSRLAAWTSDPADTAEQSPDETADPRTTDQTQATAADPRAAETQATAAGPLSPGAPESPPEAADPHAAEDHAAPLEAIGATYDPPGETQAPSTDPLTAGANESPFASVDPPVADVHAAPLHTIGATPDPRAANANAVPPAATAKPGVTVGATPEPRAADDNAPPLATIGATPDPRATDDNAAPLASRAMPDPRAADDNAALLTAIGAPPDPRADHEAAPVGTSDTMRDARAAGDNATTLTTIGASAHRRPTDANTARHATTAARPPLQAPRTGRGTLSPRHRSSARRVNARRIPAGPRRHRSTPRSRRPPVRPPGR